MMPVTEGFQGRLDVTLRQREIIPALLANSPFREDELHIPLQFRFDEQLPLVISFFEYYRFLERLVGVVLREQIAPLVLVRVKMPSVLALPAILLDARVAIFYDLEVESRELAAQGSAHLCIDANFKLYSWSSGDNRFAIRWVSPAGQRLAAAALETIRAVVATLPAHVAYFADPAPEREGPCSP